MNGNTDNTLPTLAAPVARVEALLARRPRGRQIAHLADTRALHRLLCAYARGQRAPRAVPGCYRQADEPVVMRMPMPGPPIVTPARAAGPVAVAMAALGQRIVQLLAAPPPGDDGKRALVTILTDFYMIHPYGDGNGRIARILFRRAAALSGIALSPRWTLDRRPYGAGLSMALRCAEREPEMMHR